MARDEDSVGIDSTAGCAEEQSGVGILGFEGLFLLLWAGYI